MTACLRGFYTSPVDVSYTLQDIDFEWRGEKAAANLQQHGVSFETACEAFFDPFLRVEDAGVVEGEPREAVIGLTVGWRLLYVVYVMRDDDGVVRIISARPVTGAERKYYESE
ncbi:MAG: BrnT family toxin [Pyrinomonadaceae bacterium]